MFRVDRSQNRITRLDRSSFSGLGLTERAHLQEWLANQPDALGEKLLIIQKEFDGFDGTRERLDLLALDSKGRLVVIENKLDDSGREVAWQAIKYAAYVSSLTKAQIIDIFQQYLDRYCSGGNATEAICAFMDVESLDELVLNPGQEQRLIFIAANFRREVTATVLWLREHGIDARCHKVTPYLHGEELLIDIQPVIPTPEAADFMISMAEKENEERSIAGAQRWSHEMRLAFWTALLQHFQESGFGRWHNISPSRDSWIGSATGVTACFINLTFLRHEIRVDLSLNRANAEENKWLFDRLHADKEKLEAEYGEKLEWLRKDDRKVSIICCTLPVQGYTKENWPGMIEWMADHYQRMATTFIEQLARLAAELHAGGK